MGSSGKSSFGDNEADIVKQYKDMFIQRSEEDRLTYHDTNDTNDSNYDDGDSVFEEFFHNSNTNTNNNLNNNLKKNENEEEKRRMRQHGDDVIYKRMTQNDNPKYSRYAGEAPGKGDQQFKKVNMAKFKANIIPDNLKASQASQGHANGQKRSLFGNRNYENEMLLEEQRLLRDEIERQKAELYARDQEISKLHGHLDNYKNTIKQLEDKNSSLDRKVKISEENIANSSSQAEPKSSRTEVEENKTSLLNNLELERLKDEILEQKARNLSLSKQISKLTKERQNSLVELKTFKENFAKREKLVEMLKEKNKLLEDKMKNFETSSVKREINGDAEDFAAAMQESLRQFKSATNNFKQQ